MLASPCDVQRGDRSVVAKSWADVMAIATQFYLVLASLDDLYQSPTSQFMKPVDSNVSFFSQ